MLKRIYIDNFRCLVNFELQFDSLHLFLGNNGTGKSSVFDVLMRLQEFIVYGANIDTLFHFFDCTSWQTSSTQTFELEIEGNGGIYKYKLAVTHKSFDELLNEPHEIFNPINIEYEQLYFQNKLLMDFSHEEVKIYSDLSSLSSDSSDLLYKFPFINANKSVFGFIKVGYGQITRGFYEKIKRLVIIKITPSLIEDNSEKEHPRLLYLTQNYTSWYRYISQDQGKVLELIDAIKEIFEDFAYFKFEQMGEFTRLLKVCFTGESKKLEYKLSQLSDGQKVLIILYTLITCLKGEDYTLCIDEPENFLALAEIQPWLIQLNDLCAENQLQAFLISHHPEVMNFASSVGYWFERPNNHTPVRVKPLSEKIKEKNFQDPSLTISELIARGWLDD